ncbi:MAG: hypothetical protein H7840_03315 [Alphaproteobacteria bacterium]
MSDNRPWTWFRSLSCPTLWNGVPLLTTHPYRYIALVLIAPPVVAAILVGVLVSGWMAIPTLFAAGLFMWVFQYLFFQ